jgi:hypothetical protein
VSKTITQVIAEHRGGLVARKLDDQLAELIEAVQAAGKKGSLSIKLTATPRGKSNREIHVQIVPTLRLPPDPETADESIWYGVRGALQRDDPDQREMFGPKGIAAESLDPNLDTDEPHQRRA